MAIDRITLAVVFIVFILLCFLKIVKGILHVIKLDQTSVDVAPSQIPACFCKHEMQ